MDAGDAQLLGTHSRSLAIAPTPVSGVGPTNLGGPPRPTMPYTCQTCTKRKVKCDKSIPMCSSCRKSKLECSYQAPLPRQRKRKLSSDVLERLSRYEHILRKHGLLDAAGSPFAKDTSPEDPICLLWNEPGMGKIVASQGKSRYIDSGLWRNLGDDEFRRMSNDDGDNEEEDEDIFVYDHSGRFPTDPLTGAFMGYQQGLLQYHPTHVQAMVLWEAHVENVEPLCKILHVPSTGNMVRMASQQPETLSKTDECLLFAIYHFAVFSMTEKECAQKLGQYRATLLQQFHFAARQALVNASFLKTTEISVLQALVLFLIPGRHSYDSNTYWILTGLAVRIAQRMGIHRDGEKLGLPPFEVQMRSRLFYQLLPLDGIASQLSGVKILGIPDGWDTKQPLNVNDDQIWPGMTETPQEQKGATEMIFCLSRSTVGKFFAKAGGPSNGTGSGQFKNYHDAAQFINGAESEVEEKYIRYCDILNPLHFLTIGIIRAGITTMRLRTRLPKARSQTATDAEMREIFQLAQKIMDTDTAIYAHADITKYHWHVKPVFLWGTWDSLIFVLGNLWKRTDWLSSTEADAAWVKVQQLYHNHDELLESKRALYIALGKLTLKAWVACPPSDGALEPAFIKTLRSLQKTSPQRQENNTNPLNVKADTTLPTVPSSTDYTSDPLGKFNNNIGMDNSNDFDINATDWMFWDQLVQDYQTQDG